MSVNFNELMFWLFVATSAVNLTHIAMYLSGANLYDMRRFRFMKSNPRKRWYRTAPLVSIIIPTYNGEKVIERCLESIRSSSYKKVEIFVHNDKSTDMTSKVVRAYQKQHKEMKLWIVDRRRHSGKGDGVNYCLKNFAKGELVMTLDDDTVLAPDAIRNSVSYFRDPNVSGVAANVRIIEEQTVLGLLQRFEHMIGYRSKKFFSLANCEIIIGGVGSMYRRKVMEEVGYYDTDTVTEDIGLSMKIAALGNRKHRLVYGVDVVAMTEGVETFRALIKQRYRWKLGNIQNLRKQIRLLFNPSSRYTKMLTFYRIPFSWLGEILLLIEPVVVGYVLYRTFQVVNPAIFIGAYFTITLYILLNILPDEHLSRSKKLRSSLYAPSLYFIFYIMNVVQVAAILRCLLNVKKIVKPPKHSGAWKTAQRTGKQQVAIG